MATKVAYIIGMGKGGVPGFTHREVETLHANGFDIALFPLTYREGPYMPADDWLVFRPSAPKLLFAQLPRLLTRPGMYLSMLTMALRANSLREFVLAMSFVGNMAKWGPSHIHCHFADSKLYTGYYCSRWLDLPLTLTAHAYDIHLNPNPKMLKIALGRCEKLVVQSEFNRDLVMRNFGIPEEKTVLIRAHGDMSEPGGRSPIKVLMVGEFREKKGHEVLFEAIRRLGRDDIIFWIVGEGPLDLRRTARKMGVADKLRFLGVLGPDLLSIVYDGCDMLVQPSVTASDGDMEGIPAVIMEAMSRGKPVISTRHAGIPELVEEILVNERDPDGLAEAIAKLADDAELRGRLGARNVEIIKNDFAAEAAMQLGELFHKE
jgi:colanic acid/amylovoran biosynthesis glycosyltransferase